MSNVHLVLWGSQCIIKMYPTPDVAAGCRLIGSGESAPWAIPPGNVGVAVQQLDGFDIDVETKPITHPQWSELTWPRSAHNRFSALRGSSGKWLTIPKQIKPPRDFSPVRSNVDYRTPVSLFSWDHGVVLHCYWMGETVESEDKLHPL